MSMLYPSYRHPGNRYRDRMHLLSQRSPSQFLCAEYHCCFACYRLQQNGDWMRGRFSTHHRSSSMNCPELGTAENLVDRITH